MFSAHILNGGAAVRFFTPKGFHIEAQGRGAHPGFSQTDDATLKGLDKRHVPVYPTLSGLRRLSRFSQGALRDPGL
jgi:hypothetical protein